MKMRCILLVLLLFTVCYQYTKAQNNDLEIIKQQAQERIDNGLHLATIIGVVDKNGKRFYSFGQKSLDDKTKPDENSLFEIGSVTKTFTTLLLADLELENTLKMNTPVSKYLPVFKTVKSKKEITLEDLMNHTSGLPRDPSNVTINNSNRYGDYTFEKLNEFLNGYRVSKQKYLYSNLAYIVLEAIIEQTTKKDYEILLEDNVFQSLGMKDTYFNVPYEKSQQLITPYRKGKHVDAIDMGAFPAPGGIISSAKDMLIFLEAQLGIRKSKLDKAIKNTHIKRFEHAKENIAMAWKIMNREISGKTIYYHKGGTNGFVSFAGFNIEDQIGVIVLSSGSNYFSDLGFNFLDPTYEIAKPKY